MDTLTGQKKFFQLYDKSLSRIETPQGTLTLVSVFLPFFVEMLLTNSMGTVNTLVLSHYSDEAVASVGAANQLMGMIFTFYTVISTGRQHFYQPPAGGKAEGGGFGRRLHLHILRAGAQPRGGDRAFPLCPQADGNDAAKRPGAGGCGGLFPDLHLLLLFPGADIFHFRHLPELRPAENSGLGITVHEFSERRAECNRYFPAV